MGDPKQQAAQLNGAYYGPPVLPPRSAGRRRRSSDDCGCCCLFTTLLKFVVSFVVTIGVIVLVLWLVFRPHRIQVHVESASLTQFNLLTNSTNALAYNLTMDISVRNPNRRIAFYYDRIEARAIYDGYRFGYDPQLPTFYQGHKNTTTLHTEFQGQQPTLGSVVATFEREKGEGSFYVQVKLYTKLRMKLLKFVKVGHFKPKFDCMVKLPVPSGKGTFERTKCDVDWH